jgi:hypothetical protein
MTGTIVKLDIINIELQQTLTVTLCLFIFTV